MTDFAPEPRFTVDDMHAAGLERVSVEFERDAAWAECERLERVLVAVLNTVRGALAGVPAEHFGGTESAWLTT